MTTSKAIHLTHLILILVSLAFASIPVFAQEAPSGIVMPITLSAGAMISERGREADPQAATFLPGARIVFYPGLKINSRWFVSSAVQVQSAPFFYYEAFYPEKEIETHVQELSLNYSHTGEQSSLDRKSVV